MNTQSTERNIIPKLIERQNTKRLINMQTQLLERQKSKRVVLLKEEKRKRNNAFHKVFNAFVFCVAVLIIAACTLHSCNAEYERHAQIAIAHRESMK